MSVTGVILAGQFPIHPLTHPKYSQFAADTDKGHTHEAQLSPARKFRRRRRRTGDAHIVSLLALSFSLPPFCFMGNFLLLFQIPEPKAAADRERPGNEP